jgi:bifunctional DNA-binding transcriptional regulator/antitoxin component of YhaV-PrlF toxin-antitoxin module
MANKVGAKGQVVIEKAIRERLGVRPGWQALQIPGEDHVKIYFVPPPHRRSLLGAARPFIQREGPPPTDAEMDEAIAEAMVEAWKGKVAEE